MKAVWKYRLPYTNGVQVDHLIPSGAEILHVAMQNGAPQMWVLVDPDAPMERRSFQIVGTGHPEVDIQFEYVGTVPDGSFVWHFFEVGLARHTPKPDLRAVKA